MVNTYIPFPAPNIKLFMLFYSFCSSQKTIKHGLLETLQGNLLGLGRSDSKAKATVPGSTILRLLKFKLGMLANSQSFSMCYSGKMITNEYVVTVIATLFNRIRLFVCSTVISRCVMLIQPEVP